MRQVSEVPLLLGSVVLCLAPSVCLVAARGPIVDAEENRYYISLEGDLYLYVGPQSPRTASFSVPSTAQTHNTN
jgi:hypothetical protein